MKMIQMTEPQVLPAPKTKPSPRIKPKEKPRRDDPWTVPAPKVNPTPKAIIITVMKTMKFKNGKMLIETRDDLDFIKSMTSKEVFLKKYTVSPKLVTRMLAEQAMCTAAFTDVSSVYVAKEKRKLKNN